MAQGSNLSSWAGEAIPSSPDFSYAVPADRAKLVMEATEKAFPSITISSMGMLRPYSEISLYDNSLEGIYALNIKPYDGLSNRLIVHIKPQSNEEVIGFGARVFNHLRVHGVSATEYFRTASGAYNQDADGYMAYFTNYARGSHPYSAPSILQAFGNAIGLMESAFNALPDADKLAMRANSESEYELWSKGSIQCTALARVMSVRMRTREMCSRSARIFLEVICRLRKMALPAIVI